MLASGFWGVFSVTTMGLSPLCDLEDLYRSLKSSPVAVDESLNQLKQSIIKEKKNVSGFQ